MPTINIPAKLRFYLYILGAIASLVVSYAVDKTWAGDAEVRLVSGAVGLLQLLAAAKTDLSGAAEDGGPGMNAGVDPTQPTDVE